MTETTIEIARPEDAGEIWRLIYRSWCASFISRARITRRDIDDNFKSMHLPDRVKAFGDRIANTSLPEKHFVARTEGQIVGYCRVAEEELENALYVIHVDPAYLRARIGWRLWGRAKLELNPAKSTYLMVFDQNELAMAAYRKWGFELTNESYLEEPLQSGARRRMIKMVLPVQNN